MNKTDKILILGAEGLVGSAINKLYINRGFTNITKHNRQLCDLLNKKKTLELFKKVKPDYVFFTAAKVGGINAHIQSPEVFKNENLKIQNNVFEAIRKFPPKRVIFFGSNCIFPKNIDRAIKEADLEKGDVETTSKGFAQAKIEGIKTAKDLSIKKNIDIVTVIPASLYGGVKFKDPTRSHVISGLVARMHTAKTNNVEKFEVWGSGNVLREFLHVDDLANACIKLMSLDKRLPLLINIGSGEEVSIRTLAELIKKKIAYNGELVFDSTKPDGVAKKLLDSSIMHRFGWSPSILLEDGIENLISTLE